MFIRRFVMLMHGVMNLAIVMMVRTAYGICTTRASSVLPNGQNVCIMVAGYSPCEKSSKVTYHPCPNTVAAPYFSLSNTLRPLD